MTKYDIRELKEEAKRLANLWDTLVNRARAKQIANPEGNYADSSELVTALELINSELSDFRN